MSRTTDRTGALYLPSKPGAPVFPEHPQRIAGPDPGVLNRLGNEAPAMSVKAQRCVYGPSWATGTETVSMTGTLAPVNSLYRSVSLATTPLAVPLHHRTRHAHFRVFPRGFLLSRHAPVCPRLDFPLVHPTSGAADLSLSGQKVSDSFGPPLTSPSSRNAMLFTQL
jgi:hypothetical protein